MAVGGGESNTALCALEIDDTYRLARVSNEFLETYVLNQYSADADESLYGCGLSYLEPHFLNVEAYGAFYKSNITESSLFDFTDVTFMGIPLEDITEGSVMTKYNLAIKSIVLDSYGKVALYHLSGTIEIIRGATLQR